MWRGKAGLTVDILQNVAKKAYEFIHGMNWGGGGKFYALKPIGMLKRGRGYKFQSGLR